MNDKQKVKLLQEALADLLEYCVNGSTRYHSRNPYLKPEIEKGLQSLAYSVKGESADFNECIDIFDSLRNRQ